jgi:NOL1/NOP2/fmu family ribosome biogenesis protein
VSIHVRQVFAEPLGVPKPMKFKGYLIPEYISATFYVIDNDGIKVTSANAKQFKTWTIELLLRVTKAETVDVVEIKTKGAKDYKNHIVITTKPDEPDTYSTLKASHFNQLQANRVRLISVAVQVAIQTSRYKKDKSGNHSWTIGDHITIKETELERINDEIVKFSYTKLDGTFYETFAERYRQLVTEGDKTPIKTLQNLYYPDKSAKHVQSYATTCRKKGLLPKAEKGKNSPVRKPTKRKER